MGHGAVQSDDLGLWCKGEGGVSVATVVWLVELSKRRVLMLTACPACGESSGAPSGPWRAEGPLRLHAE